MKGVVHDIPNDIRGAWWYHEVFIGHIRQSPAADAMFHAKRRQNEILNQDPTAG